MKLRNRISVAFLFFFCSGQIFGQILEADLAGVKIGTETKHKATDTIPVVSYLEKSKKEENIAWELDGQLVDQQVLHLINPDQIKEITVDKESLAIEDQEYEGMVRVTTKDDYKPKLVSLNSLASKYLSLKEDKSRLFLLDGKVLVGDYDKPMVDEKYILKAEVENIQNREEDLNLYVIKLQTRTEENLEDINTIRVRGNKSSEKKN